MWWEKALRMTVFYLRRVELTTKNLNFLQRDGSHLQPHTKNMSTVCNTNLSRLQTCFYSDKCFITAVPWCHKGHSIRFQSVCILCPFSSVTVLQMSNPNHITSTTTSNKAASRHTKRWMVIIREISGFPFQTTGITQINSLCWNIPLPHKTLSRRTRCQIIGCAEWGRCWPEAIEQVRTASSI